MIDEALQIALGLVKRFEGFSATPYLCPAGVPTIGFGSTRYADGSAVTLKDPPIKREAAEALAIRQIAANYLRAVIGLCPAIDTAGRLGAIIDFAYNLGTRSLAASTLRKRINAGEWGDVPAQLLRWRFGGGRELRGLLQRRIAEGVMV